MHRYISIAIILFCAICFPRAGRSAVFTLSDGNATATVENTGGAGMYDWKVDGVDYLQMQWFWLRIGESGPESRLDSLPFIRGGLSDTNGDDTLETLYLQYASTKIKVELTFMLRRPAGSGTSGIVESIAITNVSSSSLNLHFFQYVDLDLYGSRVNDSVEITGGNTATQWFDRIRCAEAVATPAPSHFQVGMAHDILNSLQDQQPTTLSDASGPIGPGNLTWAFQWDATLAAKGKLLISKDKQIVPEPATLALLMLGSLAAVIRRRKA